MYILLVLLVVFATTSCKQSTDSISQNDSQFKLRIIGKLLGVEKSDSLREYYFENIYKHEVVNLQESIEYDSLAFILDSLASQASSLSIVNNEKVNLFSILEEHKKYGDYISFKIRKSLLFKNIIDIHPRKLRGKDLLCMEYAIDSTMRKKRKIYGIIREQDTLCFLITWSSQTMLQRREIIGKVKKTTKLDFYSWGINEYTDTIWTNIEEHVIRNWYPHFKGIYIKEKYEEVYIDYGKYPNPKDVFKTIKIVKSKK